MPQKYFRTTKATIAGLEEPHSWSDLDLMGLGRDHYYRSFIELGRDRCPRCHHTNILIKWQRYGVRHGWEYRCETCTQIWREPKITPELVRENSETTK